MSNTARRSVSGIKQEGYMKIEIKNRSTGEIILCGDYESIKECLKKNSGADLSGADLSRADLRGADLSGADLRGADLSRADLSRADLSRADLSRAYLRGADLRGADLSGADLYWADLRGAGNIQMPIINLNGSRHHFFYLNGEIQIGCEKHTIEHWKENYSEIGKANEYTEEQIKEYFGYINMINNLVKQEA